MAGAYQFQSPTQYLTYHAQLQEWADRNHVLLEWQLLQTEYVNGVSVHSVCPSIAGNRVTWAVGRGRQMKHAKDASAEVLINTPGALSQALNGRG
ncbi:unnamed protein product [Rhizoctonia solani]|uniref:Uncharacterized protein n=1 Tax=Rhizoctonia solani TaxID=456999 RepID=A0A8H3C5K6_9AGAM|nr:unnamed protein product [Rhizoctonia solani]